MQVKKRTFFQSNLKKIAIITTVLLLIIGAGASYGQKKNKKRNGVYLGGQKGWNIFKSRKKFSHIKNRKQRKKISTKNNNVRKRNSAKRNQLKKFNKSHSAYKRNGKVRIKKTKLGKSGSLYSYNKKKAKSRKGGYASSKSDFESKLTISLSSGIVFTNPTNNLNTNDELVNIYSNYKASPHVTLGVLYNFNKHISAGLDVRAFRMTPNSDALSGLKLNAFITGLHLKYSLANSSNITPYITLGPTFSFTQFTQESYTTEETGIKSTDPEDVNVTTILTQHSAFRTQVIPLYGAKIGLGVNFKVNSKFQGFIQGDLDYSAAKNKREVKEYFNKNKADYIFYGLSFGLRYNLFAKNPY